MSEKHQEKLSLLKDLIALSKVDGNVSFQESDFIHTMARSLGISETELEQIENNPIEYNPEDREIDRIIQFYRLLLLMGIDQHRDEKEINLCKKTGLKMGLNPIAINNTIEKISNSETGMLPPEEVIKIFQISHN